MMTTAEAARDYSRRGWSVFPVHTIRGGRCSCGELADRTTHKSAGKHPATLRGFKDASKHLPEVIQFWVQMADANVAIATGAMSGLAVIDVDDMESLELIESTLGAPLPDGPIVITGRGVHRYFAYPDGGCPSVNALFPGVDVKADGGFVVAPPSIHLSGKRYEWNPYFGPDTPLPELPAPLLAFIREPRRTQRKPELRDAAPGGSRRLEEALRFQRVRRRYERDASGLNDQSPSGVDFGLCCALAACGLSQNDIEDALLRSREQAGLPPKRSSYLRHTVSRALEAVA